MCSREELLPLRVGDSRSAMSPQQTPRVEGELPSLALSLPARPGLGEEITSVCPRLGSRKRPSPPGYSDGVAYHFLPVTFGVWGGFPLSGKNAG